MRGWHKSIKEDLAPLTIIPRGFGGSTIHDANHYIDRVVIPYKPRAILLYEGDNDVAGGYNMEEIVAKYREFVKRVHAALPEARIYVLSTKPSESRWKHWPATQQLNAELKKMCDGDPRLTFIDVATPMLDENGEVRKELFLGDKLHMNPEGYKLWTSVVRPVLMQKEGEFDASR
jgi:lysophospholipase L1-like esterase